MVNTPWKEHQRVINSKTLFKKINCKLYATLTEENRSENYSKPKHLNLRLWIQANRPTEKLQKWLIKGFCIFYNIT